MSLIAESDTTLQNRLVHTASMLYDQYFLPSCQRCRYLTEFAVVDSTDFPTLCTVLRVKLSTQSDGSKTYIFEEEKINPPRGPLLHFWDLVRFQYRFFSCDLEILTPMAKPIIKRSSWYPHMASYILNWEVKERYQELNPLLSSDGKVMRRTVYTHFVGCLSYAHPTEENLASLRALRILSSHVFTPWHPPTGFCSVVLTLLQVSIIVLIHCQYIILTRFT